MKMEPETCKALQQEWTSLQNSCERSEALALAIKLVAVILCLAGIISGLNATTISLLLLVLWLQEAIWKTFQSRTEQRLLAIEHAWSDPDPQVALRFYSDWEASRPGTAALIADYLSSALRPTVAFPYLVLIPVAFISPLL